MDKDDNPQAVDEDDDPQAVDELNDTQAMAEVATPTAVSDLSFFSIDDSESSFTPEMPVAVLFEEARTTGPAADVSGVNSPVLVQPPATPASQSAEPEQERRYPLRSRRPPVRYSPYDFRVVARRRHRCHRQH